MAPLASVFNDGTLGEYIAGSWSKQIAFGLAWSRPYFLLHPAPEYRAPSWSWASVDGVVSSVALAWPENLMQEHAASPSWIERYQPRLVSHNILLTSPSSPYGAVREGSRIVIEGSCIGLRKLTEALSKQEVFDILMVLDQSQMFDCPCCSPRSVETQKTDVTRFNRESEHHLCMIIQGDAWRSEDDSRDFKRGFCDFLVLKTSDQGDTLTRVGFLRLQKEIMSVREPIDPHAVFDALPWERRELKLI